jgi:hypothetical protein
MKSPRLWACSLLSNQRITLNLCAILSALVVKLGLLSDIIGYMRFFFSRTRYHSKVSGTRSNVKSIADYSLDVRGGGSDNLFLC